MGLDCDTKYPTSKCCVQFKQAVLLQKVLMQGAFPVFRLSQAYSFIALLSSPRIDL